MRTGLWGARADGGGLAAMTHEFWRHLRPERTMVIDLGPIGRGPSHHTERYDRGDIEVTHGYNDAITPEAIRRFCHGLDVIYAAETFYREDFADHARAAGVRTVLHVMPELYRRDMAPPDRIWVPTEWAIEWMPPGTKVVPVPIPERPDRAAWLESHATFLHIAAPAMHDRNGTRMAIDAMAEVTTPITLIQAGGEKPPPIHNRHGARVEIVWNPGMTYDRWDVYPAVAGGLLLPRRYGGLSLPMQEAAALGLPIVSLDLPPQNGWLLPETVVPCQPERNVRMVGGHFAVHGPTPGVTAPGLGAAMSRLAADRDLWRRASKASRAHAEQLAWSVWEPEYRKMLEEAAA